MATWEVETTYSGSNTWTDEHAQSHTLAWEANGSNVGCGPVSFGTGYLSGTTFVVPPVSITSTGTITKKFTWVAHPRWIDVTELLDPSGDPFDPYYDPLNEPFPTLHEYFYDADLPPDTVTIDESASAGWSALNLFSTIEENSPDFGDPRFSGSASTSIDGAYAEEAAPFPTYGSFSGAQRVEVGAGGSFTRTATLNVTCSTSGVEQEYDGDLNTSLGFSVGVVPDQYGFQEIGRRVIASQALGFAYIWKCTTGSLASFPLGASVYEHTDYSGDGAAGIDQEGYTHFIAKNPPFQWAPFNPLDPYTNVGDLWEPAIAGAFTDFHSCPPILRPSDYTQSTGVTGTVTAAQQYRYHLPITSTFLGQRPVKTASGTSSDYSIVRTVTFTPASDGQQAVVRYTISKGGLSTTYDF